MRIISGTNKGMKLYAPEGDKVRPTSDKIKEAIFNIIGPIDEDATVLELFAGSGSIGIEFLARGAKYCTFVDASHKSLNYVKKNLELCNFKNRAKVLLSDYEKAIINVSKNNEKFDYIFADPPYDIPKLPQLAHLILENELLKKGGLLIIEHPSTREMDSHPNFVEKRKYGYSSFSFYTC